MIVIDTTKVVLKGDLVNLDISSCNINEYSAIFHYIIDFFFHKLQISEPLFSL